MHTYSDEAEWWSIGWRVRWPYNCPPNQGTLRVKVNAVSNNNWTISMQDWTVWIYDPFRLVLCIQDQFWSSRGHLAMSGDIFICAYFLPYLGGKLLRHQVARGILPLVGQQPTTKNYLAQTANGAQVENFCLSWASVKAETRSCVYF